MSSDSEGGREMARRFKGGFGRRKVLKGAGALAGAALGSGAGTGFPTLWAQTTKNITLRQFGTRRAKNQENAQKGKTDPGHTPQMKTADTGAVGQRAVK